MLRDAPVGVVPRGRMGDIDRSSMPLVLLEALSVVLFRGGDAVVEPLKGRTGDLERSRSGLGLLVWSMRPGRSGDLARSRFN